MDANNQNEQIELLTRIEENQQKQIKNSKHDKRLGSLLWNFDCIIYGSCNV
jgi:hypothetical protein